MGMFWLLFYMIGNYALNHSLVMRAYRKSQSDSVNLAEHALNAQRCERVLPAGRLSRF